MEGQKIHLKYQLISFFAHIFIILKLMSKQSVEIKGHQNINKQTIDKLLIFDHFFTFLGIILKKLFF